MRRTILVAAIALVVVLAAGAAVAGGWAVTTIDEAPAQFDAGEPYDVRYTILQHGETPADVESTSLIFRRDGVTLEFEAAPTEVLGTYVARVELPEAGMWAWEVSQGWFGIQDLGSIDVASQAAAPTSSSTWLRVFLPLLALVAMGALLVQVVRRSPRRLSQRAG